MDVVPASVSDAKSEYAAPSPVTKPPDTMTSSATSGVPSYGLAASALVSVTERGLMVTVAAPSAVL